MLRGLITECDLAECDSAFPGIVRYYQELQEKPCTFLELWWRFTCRSRSGAVAPQVASVPASSVGPTAAIGCVRLTTDSNKY